MNSFRLAWRVNQRLKQVPGVEGIERLWPASWTRCQCHCGTQLGEPVRFTYFGEERAGRATRLSRVFYGTRTFCLNESMEILDLTKTLCILLSVSSQIAAITPVLICYDETMKFCSFLALLSPLPAALAVRQPPSIFDKQVSAMILVCV